MRPHPDVKCGPESNNKTWQEAVRSRELSDFAKALSLSAGHADLSGALTAPATTAPAAWGIR